MPVINRLSEALVRVIRFFSGEDSILLRCERSKEEILKGLSEGTSEYRRLVRRAYSTRFADGCFRLFVNRFLFGLVPLPSYYSLRGCLTEQGGKAFVEAQFLLRPTVRVPLALWFVTISLSLLAALSAVLCALLGLISAEPRELMTIVAIVGALLLFGLLVVLALRWLGAANKVALLSHLSGLGCHP
jgi:hypothetical protein